MLDRVLNKSGFFWKMHLCELQKLFLILLILRVTPHPHILPFILKLRVISLDNTQQNCDALRDLVSFVKCRKRKKNTHGGALLLVKLQALY